MKKASKLQETRLLLKRTRKRFKRKNVVFSQTAANIINQLENCKWSEQQAVNTLPKTLKYFKENSFKSNRKPITIKIPIVFCFYENAEDTIVVINNIINAILNRKHKIIIDFCQTKKIAIGPLGVIKSLVLQNNRHMNDAFRRYNKVFCNFSRIEYLFDKKSVTGKLADRFLNLKNNQNSRFMEESTIEIFFFNEKIRNSVDSTNNRKAQVCTSFIDYLKQSLATINCTLIPEGYSFVETLLAEVLNNTEDHTHLDESYVIGYSKSVENSSNLGLELSVVNFGPSMYEGFLLTADYNTKHINELNNLKEILTKSDSKKFFRDEDIFSYLCLQEGVSRLKYNDHSRGTGTVEFLRAFLDMAQSARDESSTPRLSILSGRTLLRLDDKLQPREDDLGFTRFSLNIANDITKLPEREFLLPLQPRFPGTCVSVSISLVPLETQPSSVSENT